MECRFRKNKYFFSRRRQQIVSFSSFTSLLICLPLFSVNAALVIPGERLKKYVFHKILTEMDEGPFCIVYMHSTVQKEDNSPGLTMLRWIYEELPDEYKDRLQAVYFIHPGLRSRLVFATLGRLLLSGGLVHFFRTSLLNSLQCTCRTMDGIEEYG